MGLIKPLFTAAGYAVWAFTGSHVHQFERALLGRSRFRGERLKQVSRGKSWINLPFRASLTMEENTRPRSLGRQDN